MCIRDRQNVKSILPHEQEIAAMEAHGVHDVWDITNIIFCDMLTTVALMTSPIEVLPTLPHEGTTDQLHALKILNPSIARPDYLQLAQTLTPIGAATHPPDLSLIHI